MNVLITGAFGNLGVMCIEKALEQGFSVTCFDVKTKANLRSATPYLNKQKYPQVKIIWGDIRHLEAHKNLLDDIEGIIHNASLLPPLTETKPELARQINVQGTLQLIALAQQQLHNIHFVFPSSVTVYGLASTDEPPRSSNDKTKATDQYTQHKLYCETALKDSRLDWSILRVGVSVDYRTTKTDYKTLLQLLRVNPNNPLEYVHPKDVATAMCNALKQPSAKNKVLLIGGGNSSQVTQSTFINASLEGLGLHLAERNFGHQSYYTHWMDTQESQRILQFQQHNFSDYKKEMANAFKTFKKILTPIRPLANWVLNVFAGQLSKT